MSASNVVPYDTNVSNFVSVKLSGKQNYHLWKAQMRCLLNSVNVCGILDDTFVGPRDSGAETATQCDNLVRGWIFGSVSEVVLEEVYGLDSAKAVWEKLQSSYEDGMHVQDGSASKEADEKTEKEDIEDTIVEEGVNSIQVIVAESQGNEDTQSSENLIERNKKLKSLIIKGHWSELESMIQEDEGLKTEAISGDGSTILHIAVGMCGNDIVHKLLFWLPLYGDDVTRERDSDGSTALHIAAIVGNKDAAELLVKRSPMLLEKEDKSCDRPWHKAYKNMHLDTTAYMLKVVKEKYPETFLDRPDDKFAVTLVVNAVSTKRYDLASQFLQLFPKAASESNEVLMALAKTFPTGLSDGEKIFYPSLKSILEILRTTTLLIVYIFSFPAMPALIVFSVDIKKLPLFFAIQLIVILICMLASALVFICLLILMACFPFFLLYYISWKGAQILSFPPIKKIENKILQRDEAKKILVQVCDKIEKLKYLGDHHPYYDQPLLEATYQNAHDVVDEILSRSPEAIQSKDKSGYDIIHLAIINRSEKIYNLIYDVEERKNIHRTYKDSFQNNILHLAGRLAPSNVLNQRTGAALQLQRELQWREEVKKIVIPTYITEENIFKETPDMVFTREHKGLVKEGEQWMKTTSESCSIAAALIITIVFAAAITVPGGSNQEKGTPLFKKETAFIIFAISDAISLFASSTALLVFLSILTTRFAEKDFIFSLPWRLFIGLFALLLSTTTMMIAFSATLFLVFCDKKPWMLAPICGLAFIPIAIFVGLQFPLMVDLFSSTYLPIFGKKGKRSFKDLIQMAYDRVRYETQLFEE